MKRYDKIMPPILCALCCLSVGLSGCVRVVAPKETASSAPSFREKLGKKTVETRMNRDFSA